jgi:hypothetical protein
MVPWYQYAVRYVVLWVPVVPTFHSLLLFIVILFLIFFRLSGTSPLWPLAFVASPLWHKP